MIDDPSDTLEELERIRVQKHLRAKADGTDPDWPELGEIGAFEHKETVIADSLLNAIYHFMITGNTSSVGPAVHDYYSFMQGCIFRMELIERQRELFPVKKETP